MSKRPPCTLAELRKRNCASSAAAVKESSSEDSDEFPDDLDPFELPSYDELGDVILGISFIQQSLNPLADVPPIVTRSMLYSLLPCRSDVDREILQLRLDKKILMMSLGSDVLDYLIEFDNYKKALEALIETDQYYVTVVPALIKTLKKNLGTDFFTKEQLTSDLGLSEQSIKKLRQDTMLLNKEDKWSFTLPKAGKYLTQLSKGRTELLTRLKRKPNKELLQTELEKSKLRSSNLGTAFHIHDLVGRQDVKSIDTTSGKLIRVVNQG